MLVSLLKTILNQIPGLQKMGLIFSTHYFTDVIDTVKRAQSDIVSLRSHGDAAWLQLQKVLERFETLKFNLYSRTCTKCRPLVKEIMGDVQTKNSSLADVLPPDKQMLLRGIVRSWIEMEMPQSGHTDVSDIDISRVQEILLDYRYVKVELERDTAVVSRTVIEKELRELQKKDINMQGRMDELETVLKKRTHEGSKLKAENTRLTDTLLALKAKLDAQSKSFVRAEEMTNSQTTHDTVKNNVLHVASDGREQIEVDNMEGVLIGNERLKEENTKYTKEMLTLTETSAVLQDQLNKAETRAEKSETLLTELRTERQEIQELLDKLSCSTIQGGIKDKEHVIAGIRHLQEENKKISSEADRLLLEIGTKEKELQAAKADIDDLSEAKLLLERENEDKHREIHELSVQVVKLKEQLKKAETQAKKSETALVKFKAEQKEIQERVKSCETEQTGGMGIDVIKTEKNQLQEANKTLSSTVERLKHDLERKTEELDTSLRELHEERKKTVVMGLRIEKSGMGKAMVDMVHKELTRRLQTILEKENIAMTVQLCQTHAEVPNGPLVVLCLNMSRVGTNIIDALAGIKADRDVYVLVLHNTVNENLPQLTPTGLRVTGNVIRQLGGIFDMAFNSDTGVYDCELNNSTADKMASTLKKYSR